MTRLNVILHGGKFTKEEDQAILAWVEENGETGWTYLARALGRNYLRAGAAVQERYDVLKTVVKKGAFSKEEDALLIKEVLKQDLDAMEKPCHKTDLNFKQIESVMGRHKKTILEHYFCILHPTIMRYKAGTLNKDVRAELIQKAKENKWIYMTDIKFDELALLPEFEGHNKTSMNSLYKDMAGKAKKRFGLKSQREVTVGQVEGWFATREIHAKSKNHVERQGWIVEAYYVAKKQRHLELEAFK